MSRRRTPLSRDTGVRRTTRGMVAAGRSRPSSFFAVTSRRAPDERRRFACRAAKAAALALLLLFVQVAAQLHPLEHLGEHRDRPSQPVAQAPQAADDCLECSLLASGANVAAGRAASAHAVPPDTELAFPVPALRVAQSRTWYRSRAPPSLS
jgi:hypothetical protein